MQISANLHIIYSLRVTQWILYWHRIDHATLWGWCSLHNDLMLECDWQCNHRCLNWLVTTWHKQVKLHSYRLRRRSPTSRLANTFDWDSDASSALPRKRQMHARSRHFSNVLKCFSEALLDLKAWTTRWRTLRLTNPQAGFNASRKVLIETPLHNDQHYRRSVEQHLTIQ